MIYVRRRLRLIRRRRVLRKRVLKGRGQRVEAWICDSIVATSAESAGSFCRLFGGAHVGYCRWCDCGGGGVESLRPAGVGVRGAECAGGEYSRLGEFAAGEPGGFALRAGAGIGFKSGGVVVSADAGIAGGIGHGGHYGWGFVDRGDFVGGCCSALPDTSGYGIRGKVGGMLCAGILIYPLSTQVMSAHL